MLNALTAATTSAIMAGAECHLYTNPAPVSPNSLITDFQEATFNGYAKQPLPAFLGPFNGDSNNMLVQQDVTFSASGALVASQSIYGVFITDTAGAVLWAAEAFPAPVQIVNAGDFVTYTFNFPEPFLRVLAST
jgi:hypothetical protein